MTIAQKIVRTLLALLFPVAWLVGCATPKAIDLEPDFVNERFSPATVDRITVLPLADMRKDRGTPLPEGGRHFSKKATASSGKGPLARGLQDQGYGEVAYAENFGRASPISDDDLAAVKPEWVRTLGPDSARWVLLMAVDDLASERTFGAAVSVKCSAYLFDKETMTLAWQHRANKKKGFGGLIGLMAKSATEREVLDDCVATLVRAFPHTQRYRARLERRETVKGMYAQATKKIGVSAPASNAPGKNEILCRLVGPVTTPNGQSFESYVIEALVREMKYLGIHADTPDLKLSLTLEDVDFDSQGTGKWMFRVKLSASGRQPFNVSDQYPFKSSYTGQEGCEKVKEAFAPAVNHLVETILKHPEFRALAFSQ